MSIVLELDPEVEARALAAASARGLAVQDYLEALVAQALGTPAVSGDRLTLDEFDALMDELAEGSGDQPAPVVLSRSEIYQDHD